MTNRKSTILENSETSKAILAGICLAHSHDLSYSEAKEALEQIDENIVDYSLELDGNEYRIISDGSIEEIYEDEIKSICEDCYELNLPDFMTNCIDWAQVASNCLADGYGHTFSSYDGSEVFEGGFYIFRTN